MVAQKNEEFRTNKERATALGLKAAPVIEGYNFGKEKTEDIIRANSCGKIRVQGLYMETNAPEPSKRCNLRCWYCYSETGGMPQRVISLAEMQKAVDIVAGYGAESVMVAGMGEPLMDRNLLPLIRYVSGKNMRFVLFTNNTLVTKEIASELHSLNVSVIAKLGSLDPEAQDQLVGVKGAHKRIMKGLETLLEAGFREPRLAVDAPIMRTTLGELEDIWRFLRKNSIIPYFEPLIHSGGALNDNPRFESEMLSKKEIVPLFNRLREIDEKEFGYTWVIREGIRQPGTEECRRNLSVLTLRHNGDVGLCVSDTDTTVGNVFQEDMGDMIESSKLLKDIRANCPKCACPNCGIQKLWC